MSKLNSEILRALTWERKREDIEESLGIEANENTLAKACGFATLDCLSDYLTLVDRGGNPREIYEICGLGRRLKIVRSRT